MDKVERCPYCGLTYPHQGPTGCLTMKQAGPRVFHSTDPYVIWPYYTGRDKGVWSDERGIVPVFLTDGWAWHYIFNTVQPGDLRACTNYRVLRVSEYMEAIRRG